MTADQQRAALGISADAYEGNIIIEMDEPVQTFTPEEIRRFHQFLERAYRDALGRDRKREANRVSR